MRRARGAMAERVAAATPAGRDRWADLVRVGSLTVVVLGHWLMAAVVLGPDASLVVDNTLVHVGALRPVTWVLQVVPLFFLVGGLAHRLATRPTPGRTPPPYAAFVRSRVDRLLRPTLVFIGLWTAVALALEVTGAQTADTRTADRLAGQPLWFLGIYLGAVALAPPMLVLHERYGLAVPVALGLGVVVVDALRLGGGPDLGTANFALVWLAIHQLGFSWADGRLVRAAGWLVAAGTGLVLLLTTVGPYPVSMIGLPGEAVSNMSPPSAALLAQAVALTGLAVLARPLGERWLARPRVWAVVVAAGSRVMTAFLWHLTAAFVVVLAVRAAGWAPALLGHPIGSGAWWGLRVPWLLACAAVTAALVAALGRFETPPRRVATGGAPGRAPAGSSAAAAVLAALGAALVTTGVLGVAVVGFGDALAGRTARLVVLDVSPFLALALTASGWALVRLAGRPRRGPVPAP